MEFPTDPTAPSDGLLSLIRPEVRARKAYTVATDTDGRAKLDQNESPYDLPDALKREIVEAALRHGWNRYPQDRPQRLTAALAEHLGLTPDHLIVGHGSNELTHTLGLCFLDAGTPIVLPHPMFSLYESIAKMHGADIISVDPEPDFTHAPDAIINAARRAEAALTVVTTPNNPTGKTIAHADLARIARSIPGFLVIDEAYYEFIEGPTAVDLLAAHPNVLVMRTFSKAMGLAGLRLGYLAAHPRVIHEMQKARLPFVVDHLAEAAGLALLARPDLLAERVAALQAGRATLMAGVRALGLTAFDTAANFFLVKVPAAPAEVRVRMAERGVRIRDVSSYRALPGYVRFSVGTPEENAACLEAFAAVLGELGYALPSGGAQGGDGLAGSETVAVSAGS
ncbi:MAG: histidinol-phosphate transaminase [Bacteroidota bacterium]